MVGGGVCMTGETTIAVGSTHPTGMHSCVILITNRKGKVMFSQVSVHYRPRGCSFTAHTYYCVVGMHPTGRLSCYCPQMKFPKVMFSQVSVCPCGGHVWQGACVAGGHVWWGCVWQVACMAGGCGVRGRRDGHCSGRYAFLFNAFLFNMNILILGQNIDEHFRRVAWRQSAAYRELADRLTNSNLSPKPKVRFNFLNCFSQYYRKSRTLLESNNRY